MARQLQVAIDCRDPDRLAAFWREVLEYRLQRPPAGHDSWSDYSRVAAAERDEATARPFVDAEVRRLVVLGATHTRTDDDESDYYAVMQDPEGNEFCIG
jgi:glyoxalase superfamily protein